MPRYELIFLKALIFTILIETIFLFALTKTLYKNVKAKNKEILFTGIFASFATLPYLWFVLPSFIHNQIIYAITGEIGVVLIETVIISFVLRIKILQSFVLSLICNMASLGFGLAFRNFFT